MKYFGCLVHSCIPRAYNSAQHITGAQYTFVIEQTGDISEPAALWKGCLCLSQWHLDVASVQISPL